MLYPTLKKKSTQRKTVSAFRGYEHRIRTSEGAFYDMRNMSAELYPLLAVRRKRGAYKRLKAAQGLLGRDRLAYVDDGTLYYNETATPLKNLGAGEKQLVSMGAYICVFPDKLYYNTASADDYGPMEARMDYSGRVRCSMCDVFGDDYPDAQSSAAAPKSPADGEYWIDSTENALKRYSASMAAWTEIESVYVKLSFTTQGQIPSAFSQYDGVEISGAPADCANGTKIIYAVGGGENETDYIVVAGEPLSETCTAESADVSIVRSVPDMDFVCQCSNRLWGCRYGNDGKENLNELYCCALGDFKNWSQYMGLSTDSWRASVGSDGAWTGAVNYLGTPLFFKENCIHRVTVSPTGAHQVSETVCRGVQRGSEKSVAVVGETLYYKSRADVCAYQGGFPAAVSAALGDERYSAAAAGAFGGKYYISMKNADGGSALFVLDTAKGLWTKEDELRADGFARVGDELFCLSDNVLYALNGTAGEPEEDVEWSAETGMLGCEDPDKKYLSRLNLRAWMEREAVIEAYVEYDSDGVWRYAGRMRTAAAGTNDFPLRLRRCDHVRLRIKGRGGVKLISMTREMTEA